MAVMSPQHPRLWLALIVVLYLLLAAAYALSVPAWQAPDEPAHYNYIHELATTGQLPLLRMGDYDQAYLDQLKAAGFPRQLSIASIRYEAHQPPLYYLLASPVFIAAGGELTAMRLFSTALGALLIVLVYAIGALVFPGRRSLALAAAAFVAFLPMHLAMSAAVNNDALAEVALAAILFLSIRYVKLALVGPRLPSGWDAAVLGVLLGLALVAKVSAYVAIPVALAAPLIANYELRRAAPLAPDTPRFALRHLALIALPALLIAAPLYVRNATVYGHLDILARRWHDTVVIGQLRTSELLAQSGLAAVVERLVAWSHNSFWGVFGWMGVWMDGRLYTLLLAFSLAVLAGCTALALRKLRAARRGSSSTASSLAAAQRARLRHWSLALLALAALLTAGIYVAYNLIFVQPQGRYLFPALPAIGLAVALGWREALRPKVAGWAGLLLILAALAAALAGALRAGINPWSVGLLAGSGAALIAWRLVQPRLPAAWREPLSTALFWLPLAALPLLSAAALAWFILPQLS
jgi:4-amino-4-deoxy-L-arabinose transferase-like glycosyltransferase